MRIQARILHQVVSFSYQRSPLALAVGSAASMSSHPTPLASLFGVLFKRRTYSRFLYLLLGLPLGAIYFGFLVTALALGGGLSIIGIGLVLLGGVLFGIWILLAIERGLAITLLGIELPPLRAPAFNALDPIEIFRSHVPHRGTWIGLVFLMAKLPLGIISFVLPLSALAVAATLTGAPLTYLMGDIDLGLWDIDHRWESIAAFFLGLPAGLATLHMVDKMGALYGWIARIFVTSNPAR